MATSWEELTRRKVVKDLKSLNADFSGQCLLLHYTEAPNFGGFRRFGRHESSFKFLFHLLELLV